MDGKQLVQEISAKVANDLITAKLADFVENVLPLEIEKVLKGQVPAGTGPATGIGNAIVGNHTS